MERSGRFEVSHRLLPAGSSLIFHYLSGFWLPEVAGGERALDEGRELGLTPDG